MLSRTHTQTHIPTILNMACPSAFSRSLDTNIIACLRDASTGACHGSHTLTQRCAWKKMHMHTHMHARMRTRCVQRLRAIACVWEQQGWRLGAAKPHAVAALAIRGCISTHHPPSVGVGDLLTAAEPVQPSHGHGPGCCYLRAWQGILVWVRATCAACMTSAPPRPQP